MSFSTTLSHAVFALNEKARRNLCALFPSELAADIKPPSCQKEIWEEDMLDQHLYLDAESDGTILAGWDGEGGRHEGGHRRLRCAGCISSLQDFTL